MDLMAACWDESADEDEADIDDGDGKSVRRLILKLHGDRRIADKESRSDVSAWLAVLKKNS